MKPLSYDKLTFLQPFCSLFFSNKEDMQHQNLKQLLQFLASTPNGDKYMQFVLHLAEQSVTAETLQALIHSGKQINTVNSKKLGNFLAGHTTHVAIKDKSIARF